MNYYIAKDRFGNYDLAHHGIKGQRWGIRRYQNEDGSWTEAGRKRYGVGESSYRKKIKGALRLRDDLNEIDRKISRNTKRLEKANKNNDSEKINSFSKNLNELQNAANKGRSLYDQITKDPKIKEMLATSDEALKFVNSGFIYLKGAGWIFVSNKNPNFKKNKNDPIYQLINGRRR